MSLARPTVLVIHDQGDALDLLTRVFEARGFDVVTAVTGFRATAHLEGERRIDVVVAPWDLAHPVGGEVYRWALQRRYDLRDLFVFIAAEVHPDFDHLVAGRCLAVALDQPSEIVRVAQAAVKRRVQLEAARALAEVDSSKPRLLLADDDPVLLAVMGDFLSQSGYAVTRVETGHAAIVLLEHADFEVIVLDWHMDDGSGADVFRWMRAERPHLAERVVFLSGGEADEAHEAHVARGRPMFRKGQDSHALIAVLHEIVRHVRTEPAPG